MAAPLVKTLIDVNFNSGEATEGWEERFVRWRVIEELSQIVRGIDGNGAVLEF